MCIASGDYNDFNEGHTYERAVLEEEDAGGSWHATRAFMNKEGINEKACLAFGCFTAGFGLRAIACNAPESCVGAGAVKFFPGFPLDPALAAVNMWSGSWNGALALNPPAVIEKAYSWGLDDISCADATWCASVGSLQDVDGVFHGLVEIGEAPLAQAGGLGVQPPQPTPPLTVTVANGGGGGGGTAGAPDPSSLEHGHCDPGADTSWLNIAGTTFTCIGSGDIWDDPSLISARKKCIINLGIDFAPFFKALKWRKYAKAAKAVKLSLKTLAQRVASSSYPGKLSGDAKAVDDLRTGLDLIKTPDQAILTAVSSRRVLDGLITKLGKGGPQALKLARGIGVVEAAVINLIKTVSGIQDLQDCVAAFDGP
jgi:hypothetical protein